MNERLNPYQYPTLSLHPAREAHVEFDILDCDGSHVNTLTGRAFDAAGAACVYLSASPRALRVVNGRPAVILRHAELLGARLWREAWATEAAS